MPRPNKHRAILVASIAILAIGAMDCAVARQRTMGSASELSLSHSECTARARDAISAIGLSPRQSRESGNWVQGSDSAIDVFIHCIPLGEKSHVTAVVVGDRASTSYDAAHVLNQIKSVMRPRVDAGAGRVDRVQGTKIALQSDTGDYLGRCDGCIPDGTYPDSAFVHVTEAELPSATYAHFTLERLPSGKYALQSDTGGYLGRCNNCVPGGAYPDSAFVHVTEAELPSATYAHFTLERLPSGKYALQSDTGDYLARCNNCVPGGVYPNSAFMHVTKEELERAAHAHWDMVVLP